MRLLHCIHSSNPEGGGPVSFLRQLTCSRESHGLVHALATLDRANGQAALNCPVYNLGSGASGYGFSPAYVPWLRKNRLNYDLVVVHGLWQFTSLGAWLALRGSGTPYVVFPHGMLDPWFNQAYPLKRLKKMLYWPLAEYRVLKDAKAVLFTAEEERLLARTSFRPYRAKEIVVGFGTAEPPVDAGAARARFLSRFPQLAGRRFILFLGRLHEKKGLDLLISAFSRIAAAEPALFLVVAGPDSQGLGERLRERLACQSPQAEARIIWTGLLPDDLKWGALAAGEALVLPSHQENFGLCVSEAMSLSRPVLISNKVNIWSEVERYQAGLVESDDQDGVDRLFARYLAMDEQARQVMGERARQCYLSSFELGSFLGRLAGTLQSLVGTDPESPGVAPGRQAGKNEFEDGPGSG